MDASMNLDTLRYVAVVADTGSMTQAAHLCAISQPALSKAVARLETTLGQPIFERSTRGVRPTAFGESALPIVRRILAETDRLTALAMSLHESRTRSLRLGISPVIAPDLVSEAYRVLRDLGTGEPRQLVVKEENLADLRRDLADDRLDLILLPATGPTPGMVSRLVDWEPLVLVEAEASGGGDADVSELARRELIMVPDSCGLTRVTRELLASHRVTADVYPGEAMSYAVLEQWARLGLGDAVLPESKVSAMDSSVRCLRDDDGRIEIFYEAVWNPRSGLAAELEDMAGRIAAGRAPADNGDNPR